LLCSVSLLLPPHYYPAFSLDSFGTNGEKHPCFFIPKGARTTPAWSCLMPRAPRSTVGTFYPFLRRIPFPLFLPTLRCSTLPFFPQILCPFAIPCGRPSLWGLPFPLCPRPPPNLPGENFPLFFFFFCPPQHINSFRVEVLTGPHCPLSPALSHPHPFLSFVSVCPLGHGLVLTPVFSPCWLYYRKI